MIIQDFPGDVPWALLRLLEDASHVFGDNAHAEKLYAAEEERENKNGGEAAGHIRIVEEGDEVEEYADAGEEHRASGKERDPFQWNVGKGENSLFMF